jgi:hypothetical protein
LRSRWREAVGSRGMRTCNARPGLCAGQTVSQAPARIRGAVDSGPTPSTRDRSRMREFRTYGSVRGALSNGRPYRDVERSRLCATQLPLNCDVERLLCRKSTGWCGSRASARQAPASWANRRRAPLTSAQAVPNRGTCRTAIDCPVQIVPPALAPGAPSPASGSGEQRRGLGRWGGRGAGPRASEPRPAPSTARPPAPPPAALPSSAAAGRRPESPASTGAAL